VVVHNALDTVRSDAQAKGITLEIQSDQVRLEQIVWNLLNNAIKFTAEGGRIRVRVAGDDYGLVTIEGTGEGIDPSFLPYMFELFRQADSSTTRTKSGMGIGLAIVKQLVDLHGGSIDGFFCRP
jgi:Signal transduction histidine kinase